MMCELMVGNYCRWRWNWAWPAEKGEGGSHLQQKNVGGRGCCCEGRLAAKGSRLGGA